MLRTAIPILLYLAELGVRLFEYYRNVFFISPPTNFVQSLPNFAQMIRLYIYFFNILNFYWDAILLNWWWTLRQAIFLQRFGALRQNLVPVITWPYELRVVAHWFRHSATYWSSDMNKFLKKTSEQFGGNYKIGLIRFSATYQVNALPNES